VQDPLATRILEGVFKAGDSVVVDVGKGDALTLGVEPAAVRAEASGAGGSSAGRRP
jgi:hypothetical protein